MDIKNLKLNIEQKVLGAKRVVIVPHNRIDFDAIGSALGLAVIVKKMNAEPLIVVNDDISKMQRGIQTIMADVRDSYKIITRDEYLGFAHSDDLIRIYIIRTRSAEACPDNLCRGAAR
jgi:c-di-AMP phosphodiesterase-like protein